MPVIEIGKDQYGEPVTTCVVDITVGAHTSEKTKKCAPKVAKGNAGEFLKAVKWAIEESGSTLTPMGRIPNNVRGVNKETLSKYAKPLDFLQNVKPNAYRARMSQYIRKLAGDGYIGQWGDYVWLL